MSSNPPAPASLLWLITGCLALQPLSTDLYLASLPALADAFSVAPAVVQQTLSQFVLGFAGAQLISGPLSDRYGRRPVLFGGFAVYLAASLVCALAGNIEMLIAGRFLQAVGCCTGVAVARAIVRDAYPPAEGGQVIARASTWLAFAPVLGPIVGAQLQVAFGWRAAFVVHAIAAGALLLALPSFRETNRNPNPDALRPAGFIASYRHVLRSGIFWAYTLPGAFSYCAIFVFISGAPFALIKVLGLSTENFGYCFSFGVLGFLSGTIVCRRLMMRLGVSGALRVGARIALVVGLAFAAAVATGLKHWALVMIGQYFVMFAHGINFPSAQTGSVAPFAERAGAAAGLLGCFVMLAAFATGNLVGASHDGTLMPMAKLTAGIAILLFATERLLARHRESHAEA